VQPAARRAVGAARVVLFMIVVVISDSNMSLSASSEDSMTVNVNGETTANDTVWMKEGDTTEDENSITINED